MGVPVVLRNDHLDGLAEHLVFTEPEDTFRRRVPRDDLSKRVDGQNRVDGRIGDGAESHLGFAPFADVTQDAGKEARGAECPGCQRQLDGQFVSVPVAREQFHRVTNHARRVPAIDTRDAGSMRFEKPFGNDDFERLPDRFGHAPAENGFGGTVPRENAPLRVGRNDGVNRRLGDRPEVGLRLA